MNEKLAKSLRRFKANKATPSDIERIQRQMAEEAAVPKPKVLKERKRKKKDPAPPSWPKTENQKAQSRPIFIIKPERAKARKEKEAQKIEKTGQTFLGKAIN